MFTGRRILVASRKTDLAWALYHEVMRLTQWKLIGIIDPRVCDALDRTPGMADVILIEADDLIWLWDHKHETAQRTLSSVRTVIILSDRQILDVLTRVHQNFGLLLREEYGDVPVDLLEIAIKGYVSLSEALFERLKHDRLRLDIVNNLSPEELKVLTLVGFAFSNRRIAEASGLPESRVKTLVHLVTHKLRMDNRTAVAVFTAANGIADMLPAAQRPSV